MSEYYGIIQSVIKLGYDAYQVTFRIHKIRKDVETSTPDSLENRYEVLVYRAEIAIENDRSILFPDRELGRCLEAYHDSSEGILSGIGWESQRTVGRLADRICRQMSELLLKRQMTGQARAWSAVS